MPASSDKNFESAMRIISLPLVILDAAPRTLPRWFKFWINGFDFGSGLNINLSDIMPLLLELVKRSTIPITLSLSKVSNMIWLGKNKCICSSPLTTNS